MPLIPTLGRQKQVGLLSEFHASQAIFKTLSQKEKCRINTNRKVAILKGLLGWS